VQLVQLKRTGIICLLNAGKEWFCSERSHLLMKEIFSVYVYSYKRICFCKLVGYYSHANMTENVKQIKNETEDQELNDLLDSKYISLGKSAEILWKSIASFIL